MPQPFKHDIMDDLFRRNDDLSKAAGSEILRLRQTVVRAISAYYADEPADESARMFRVIQILNTLFVESNPNYPNFY